MHASAIVGVHLYTSIRCRISYFLSKLKKINYGLTAGPCHFGLSNTNILVVIHLEKEISLNEAYSGVLLRFISLRSVQL